MSTIQRRALILATVIVLLVAGHELRIRLGLELSPAGVEAWVAALGWYGPVIFVVLLALRTFVVLPSSIILSAGGLVFGVLVGTLLGWLGVVLSGALQFGLARGVFRDSRRVTTSSATRAGAITNAGTLGVAVVTAHPLGPMTPVHFGAGISSMPAAVFLTAVALAAPIRSFGFSYFGTSLADVGSTQFFAATGLLSLLIVVPLMHTNTRRRIFALSQEAKDRSTQGRRTATQANTDD